MNIEVDKIAVDIDVIVPDAVIVEASAVAPSGIVTEAVAELPTQVVVISHEETPTVTPLQIIDYGSSSIECAFDVTTEQAEEVVKGVLCGTTNPPTFENADYRLLHGQGTMDLAFAGLHVNTEYYLRTYALSNLGYKYGDVVAQRTKPSPIPDAYQLVEYLKSNGGQFIDTGISPQANIGWYLDCVIKQSSTESQTGSGYFIFVKAGSAIIYYIGNTSSGRLPNETGYDESRHLYVLDTYKQLYGYDNMLYSTTNTASSTNPILIGKRNGANYTAPLIIYNSKIYISDELIQNLYPVYRKADNKPGMYDIVNNVFYTNQGTSEFLVGPDKEWEE